MWLVLLGDMDMTAVVSDLYGLELEPRDLFSGSPKVDKSIKLGWLTAALYLAPADSSGSQLCTFSTADCRWLCLNTSGHGGIALDVNGLNSVQVARIRRARSYRRDRRAFMRRVVRELERKLREADRRGLKLCCRMNATSDIKFWMSHPVVRGGERFSSVFAAFSDVQFYDYTKRPVRLWGTLPANLHLTFSLAETADSEQDAREALAAGYNVAVVFDAVLARRGRAAGPLPATFWGYPVIDGDEHDLRFLDPQGCVVGLRAKGRAIGSESGFVRSASVEALPMAA
jgi:hypothetical protein